MAVTIDGTSGITTPSVTNSGASTATNLTTTGNTILGDASTDTLNVGNGGLVKDASGNVGIGTSSPARKLVVSNAGAAGLEIGPGSGLSSGNEYLNYNRSTSLYVQKTEYASNYAFYVGTAGGTRAVDIDSSGKLLVGTTAAPSFAGVGIQGGIGFAVSNTYYYTIQSNSTDFYIGTSTLSRYAALTGLNTFTAWSFGSDRRIKYDIEDIKYGLQDVLALQPRQYKFKNGDDFSIGFIAQELKEVVPEAVTGEEIPFDDADTPQERAKKTMAVSKDTLIPVLVKAIQEQQTLITELNTIVTRQQDDITALQADIAALKGN